MPSPIIALHVWILTSPMTIFHLVANKVTFKDIESAYSRFTSGHKMATLQPIIYSPFKLYSRTTTTDAATIRILVKLTLGIPDTPPDDGDGLGCCAEVGDVVAGVDSGVEDDDVATVLDGMLVVALFAAIRLPVDVAVAALATNELRIDE